MRKEDEEQTLADVALFLDSVPAVIKRIETCDLRPTDVSKRHIRMLDALCYACNMEEPARWVHVDIEQLQEVVALMTNKRYPLGDIRSFAFDMAARGYVDHVDHPEYGDVFAILPKGRDLLLSIDPEISDSYTQSSTPNHYAGVLQ